MNNKSILFIFTILISLNCFFNNGFAKHYEETGWKRSLTREMIDPSTPHSFRIYIKQQNLDILESTVRDVSNPSSSNYGKYLSADDITSIVSPSTVSIESIKIWVNKFNPIKLEFTANKDCLIVLMSKENIESMMDVKLSKYIHKVNGKVILRSPIDPVVPSHLLEHIDLITGISYFPVYKSIKKQVNSKSTSSESSSSAPGLQFVGIKSSGDIIKVEYQPSCAPDCNGKYFPMDVIVTPLNQRINSTITTSDITPSCSTDTGSLVCTIYANSVLYEPTDVTIRDTVSGELLSWGYSFVALPTVIPQSIKEYYGIPQNYRVTHPNATQCVVEFEQQYYSPSDLETFFDSMGLPSNTTVTVIGSNDETNPGVEASLDIQYLMGIAVGAPTTFWSIYANSTEEIDDILQWAVAISGYPNPPLVNSLSYGMTEKNVDPYLGQGYMARSEVEFQKLAARGLTVIIASGDSGANDEGPPPMGSGSCTLSADWPSNSQYVTSVGSIYFTPYSVPICYESIEKGGISCENNPIGETGVSIDYGSGGWTSGGGFSAITSTGYYQGDFVNAYIKKMNDFGVTPPSNLWNSQGRAYPDVSTVGKNLYVINGGQWLSVDGTSASAPIFAGMVTILNDIRLNNNLPPLGFINPLLYQIARDYPEAYYDVIVGNNRCGISGYEPLCCQYGYTAVESFDTVSGIGRPDMNVFMQLITQFK